MISGLILILLAIFSLQDHGTQGMDQTMAGQAVVKHHREMQEMSTQGRNRRAETQKNKHHQASSYESTQNDSSGKRKKLHDLKGNHHHARKRKQQKKKNVIALTPVNFVNAVTPVNDVKAGKIQVRYGGIAVVGSIFGVILCLITGVFLRCRSRKAGSKANIDGKPRLNSKEIIQQSKMILKSKESIHSQPKRSSSRRKPSKTKRKSNIPSQLKGKTEISSDSDNEIQISNTLIQRSSRRPSTTIFGDTTSLKAKEPTSNYQSFIKSKSSYHSTPLQDSYSYRQQQSKEDKRHADQQKPHIPQYLASIQDQPTSMSMLPPSLTTQKRSSSIFSNGKKPSSTFSTHTHSTVRTIPLAPKLPPAPSIRAPSPKVSNEAKTLQLINPPSAAVVSRIRQSLHHVPSRDSEVNVLQDIAKHKNNCPCFSDRDALCSCRPEKPHPPALLAGINNLRVSSHADSPLPAYPTSTVNPWVQIPASQYVNSSKNYMAEKPVKEANRSVENEDNCPNLPFMTGIVAQRRQSYNISSHRGVISHSSGLPTTRPIKRLPETVSFPPVMGGPPQAILNRSKILHSDVKNKTDVEETDIPKPPAPFLAGINKLRKDF